MANLQKRVHLHNIDTPVIYISPYKRKSFNFNQFLKSPIDANLNQNLADTGKKKKEVKMFEIPEVRQRTHSSFLLGKSLARRLDAHENYQKRRFDKKIKQNNNYQRVLCRGTKNESSRVFDSLYGMKKPRNYVSRDRGVVEKIFFDRNSASFDENSEYDVDTKIHNPDPMFPSRKVEIFSAKSRSFL